MRLSRKLILNGIAAVKILLLLASLCVMGCHQKELPENRFFPKNPEFTIIPEGKYDNVGIDFNAIYYNKNETQLNKTTYVSYHYYRFWPNGRVLSMSTNIFPLQEQAENFTNAQIGYYQVDGQNLIMEFFFWMV